MQCARSHCLCRADDKEINQEEDETPVVVVTADWQTKRDTNNDHAMRGGSGGRESEGRGMGLQMLQEDCTIMVDIEGSIVGFAGRDNRDGAAWPWRPIRRPVRCACRLCLFPPLQMQCR